MEEIDGLDESPIEPEGEEPSNGLSKLSGSSEVSCDSLRRRRCSTLRHSRDPSCRRWRNYAGLSSMIESSTTSTLTKTKPLKKIYLHLLKKRRLTSNFHLSSNNHSNSIS